MKGIPVIVGQALYSFPTKESLLAFLADFTKSGEPDHMVDAKAHGATFEGRAPWETRTKRDCEELAEIMEAE